MAKKANGEGSIYKRKDGRWAASISVGRGKRQHFLHKDRDVVARKLRAALKSRDDGLPAITERQTIEKFFERWLATVKPTLRERTWVRYEQYVRLHIIPTLGKVTLDKLSPQHLQRLYAERLETGLSPTTVHHLHATIHKALGQAIRWSLVPRNVADLVDAPRIVRREMSTLSPAEARSFLEAASGDRLEALYVLALTTGMRQGELLGLRWRDVDLDARSLQVRGSLQPLSQGLTVVEPKTARSRRQILLTETAVGALRRHRSQQAEERLRVGAAWTNAQDLVFVDPAGAPIEATKLLRNSFVPLLRSAGVPQIRFHDLRHTAATLLLGRQVNPKIVSEMLGHTQVGITLDLYSHVTPTMQREAAAAMDSIVARR